MRRSREGRDRLPLNSDLRRLTPVEVFLQEPFGFDNAYARALRQDVAPGIEATFVDLDRLVQMKEAVGRAQDLACLGDPARLTR